MNTRTLVSILLAGGIWASTASAGLLYSTIPGTIPPDTTRSWSFETTSTREFGNLITFDTGGDLNAASVLLSNWAYESKYETLGTSAGYTVPITLTLYSPVHSGDTVSAGTPITSTTSFVFVPWRDEPNPGACGDPDGGQPYSSGGGCYSGSTVLANFTFDNVVVSGEVIYGISFNTQNSGYAPTGVVGPYNSLNVAWSDAAPSAGGNPQPGSAFLNTTNNSIYFDFDSDNPTANTSGTFRQDFNYTDYFVCADAGVCQVDYSAAVSFSSTPEPGTVMMMLIGVAGVAAAKFRKRS